MKCLHFKLRRNINIKSRDSFCEISIYRCFSRWLQQVEAATFHSHLLKRCLRLFFCVYVWV